MNRLIFLNKCSVNLVRNSIIRSTPNLLTDIKCSNYFIRGAHDQKKNIRSTLNYVVALGVMTVGLSYAAVPLYRIFCQAYSYGGTTGLAEPSDVVSTMNPVKHRPIRVRFNADVASSMQWNFKPQQPDITEYEAKVVCHDGNKWKSVISAYPSEKQVLPGETALAFYTARNPTDKPVTGISTYNVIPFEAGQYFNKIQCFCFEEQQLNPHEQVDMPVFFYIDPEYTQDPQMEYVNEIVLSYTFFEAKEGFKLPVPTYVK